MSVLSKWYAVVLVGLWHEEREPIEWKKLPVAAKRRVNCEHMQALFDEHSTATLKMAGRSSGCMGARVLLVFDCVCGKPGREDDAQCGPALCGVSIFQGAKMVFNKGKRTFLLSKFSTEITSGFCAR